MREVRITAGVYGYRTDAGRVLPIAKGERVSVSDEEAERLVALDVAAYADDPGQPEPVLPTTSAVPSAEAGAQSPVPDSGADTGSDEDADAEVSRLERMRKDDLEQMAQDMGVDISGARNNHERAVLIAAAGSDDDGSAPLDGLDAGDIVQ